MNFYLENEIPMSARELWQILFTPEFDAFMAKEYGHKAYVELERHSSDLMMRRRVKIISKVDLTEMDLNFVARKIAAKILRGDQLGYELIQEKYFDRFEMRWKVEPPLFKDKIQAYGVLRLEPIDENRCLRIIEATAYVGIPGLDGLLKRVAASQPKLTKSRFAQVVEKWKSEHVHTNIMA